MSQIDEHYIECLESQLQSSQELNDDYEFILDELCTSYGLKKFKESNQSVEDYTNYLIACLYDF